MRRFVHKRVDLGLQSYLHRLSKRNGDNEVTNLEELSSIAKEASTLAISEAKALGLDITYIHEGIMYRESADGHQTVLKKISREIACSSVEIRKGTVLNINVNPQD